MKAYKDLLQHIITHGTPSDDRTGTGTISVFGYQNRYNLADGFPLLTTKKVPFRLVISELLWFLSGNTDAQSLQEQDNHIWDEWATKEQCAKFGREAGDLGPIYGHQWRNFAQTYDEEGVDQIQWLIHEIHKNPNSRRLIVTGWNPKEQDQVALPPCHTMFQFYVRNGKISCQLYQRSADSFLGVPFNIASYALLTHMIAHVCNLEVGEFIHSFGDLHIYNNHRTQVDLLLSREPMKLPTIVLNHALKGSGFDGLMRFKPEDVILCNYLSHPAIKAPVSV